MLATGGHWCWLQVATGTGHSHRLEGDWTKISVMLQKVTAANSKTPEAEEGERHQHGICTEMTVGWPGVRNIQFSETQDICINFYLDEFCSCIITRCLNRFQSP